MEQSIQRQRKALKDSINQFNAVSIENKDRSMRKTVTNINLARHLSEQKRARGRRPFVISRKQKIEPVLYEDQLVN